MQPAKAQDTITYLYIPYCRQVPNLSTWWGDVCGQIQPETVQPTANFSPPAGLAPTTSGLLYWRVGGGEWGSVTSRDHVKDLGMTPKI